MITLPKLPPDFAEFGGCVSFSSENQELIDWVKAHSIDHAVATFTERGEPRWLSVTLDAWECDVDETHGITIHLHVETSRVRPSRADDVELRPAEGLVITISEFIEKAVAESPTIESRAQLIVPRADIPEHGIIGRLLRFHQRSCGASFTVDQVSLKIEDEVFSRLHFREEDDEVRVNLWAETEVVFENDYLVKIVELMRIGVDCYVFERSSREVTNA